MCQDRTHALRKQRTTDYTCSTMGMHVKSVVRALLMIGQLFQFLRQNSKVSAWQVAGVILQLSRLPPPPLSTEKGVVNTTFRMVSTVSPPCLLDF